MKRWYQLSMLQLLVAMSVVAVFVVKNMQVQSTSTSQPVFYDTLSAGWPWVYWRAVFYMQATVPVLQGEYRMWQPLFANVICCLAACGCAAVVVTFLARKGRAMIASEPRSSAARR